MTLPGPDAAGAVRAAKTGDREAMDALIRALGAELLPLASALAAGSGEADMLLGDTLSRVYERLHQLRDERAVAPWARRILVRTFLERRRWWRSRRQVRLESAVVATELGTRAEFVDLRQEVRRLSREERALLVLRYWQGLSIAECAAELGVPDGTVKSRLHRVLARLRVRLEDGR